MIEGGNLNRAIATMGSAIQQACSCRPDEWILAMRLLTTVFKPTLFDPFPARRSDDGRRRRGLVREDKRDTGCVIVCV